MIKLQHIEVEGKRFVLIEEAEYQRLCRNAKADNATAEALPKLPKPDRNGRMPAAAYARVSLARDLMRRRLDASLSRRQIAELAGLREETISRLESGKYTASATTVDKVLKALDKSTKRDARSRCV